MPRPLSRSAVRERLGAAGTKTNEFRLNKEATETVARYTEKARPCLRCRKDFLSSGPHHRMCGLCRNNVSSDYDESYRMMVK